MSSFSTDPDTELSQNSMFSRIWNFLWNQPLVHFVCLAAILFIAHAIWSTDNKEEIIVDSATQEILIKQKQDLLFRPLTEEEKEQAIENYIEEEILVREARKRGLDNSSRIRRLLIQNMRFFFARDVAKPTDQELRQYFEDNSDRFQSPASVTYDHIFFKELEEIPQDLLKKLNAGADPKNVGDFSTTFPRQIRKANQNTIVRWFGPETGKKVLAISDQRWHGPFKSSEGGHFLRVKQHFSPQFPKFETAKKWIEADWQLSRQRAAIDDELKSLRNNYRVEVAKP